MSCITLETRALTVSETKAREVSLGDETMFHPFLPKITGNFTGIKDTNNNNNKITTRSLLFSFPQRSHRDLLPFLLPPCSFTINKGPSLRCFPDLHHFFLYQHHFFLMRRPSFGAKKRRENSGWLPVRLSVPLEFHTSSPPKLRSSTIGRCFPLYSTNHLHSSMLIGQHVLFLLPLLQYGRRQRQE
jgi:hypothetical protein